MTHIQLNPDLHPTEIEAVKAGLIKGEVYRDGEVWCDHEDLHAWYFDRQLERAVPRSLVGTVSPQRP